MKRLLNYTIILSLSLVVFGCGGPDSQSSKTNSNSSNEESQKIKNLPEIFDELKKGGTGVKIVIGLYEKPFTSISEKQKEVLRSINFDSLDQVFLDEKYNDTLSYSEIIVKNHQYVYHDNKPYTGYYFEKYGYGGMRIKSSLWGLEYRIKSDLVEWDDKDCGEKKVPRKMRARTLGTFKLGREIEYSHKCTSKYRKPQIGYGDYGKYNSNSCNKDDRFRLIITEYDILTKKTIELFIPDEIEEIFKSYNYLVHPEDYSTDQIIKNREQDYCMAVNNTLPYLKRKSHLYYNYDFHGPQYKIWKGDTVVYENYNLGKKHGTFYDNRDNYGNSTGVWEKREFNNGVQVFNAGTVIRYFGKNPTSVNGDTSFYTAKHVGNKTSYCREYGEYYQVYYLAKNPRYNPDSSYRSDDLGSNEYEMHGAFREIYWGNLSNRIIYDYGFPMIEETFNKSDGSLSRYTKYRWVLDESKKDSIHRKFEEGYGPGYPGINDYKVTSKWDENGHLIYKDYNGDIYQYIYDKKGKRIKEIKNGKRVG